MTSHLDTVAAKLRSNDRFVLLSPFNEKSPKGEAHGYLTAMLYLAPHTLAGGKTVCPHSTEACRAGCLFHAGRGKTPRVENARLRRTLSYLNDRAEFMGRLQAEIEDMQRVADENDLKLAIRLNGTSDIGWEREELAPGLNVFDAFPRATFYDYSRWPAAHRRVPPNWHLTFSLADDPVERALEHFAAGRSVAAVIPEGGAAHAGREIFIGDADVTLIDGDEHDLRFLDPPTSLVLLKPKGSRIKTTGMIRPHLIAELIQAARKSA